MATRALEHPARILSIEGTNARVEIIVSGGCASCSASAKCGMSESSRRELSLPLPEVGIYQVGEMVKVAVSYRVGFVAILYAYILPLIALLIFIVAGTLMGLNEGLVALAALFGVALYFFALYINKDRIEREITFSIK